MRVRALRSAAICQFLWGGTSPFSLSLSLSLSPSLYLYLSLSPLKKTFQDSESSVCAFDLHHRGRFSRRFDLSALLRRLSHSYVS